MTEIILLLFVAFLFVDAKTLVALAGRAGGVYGKLQNAKRDLLGELQEASAATSRDIAQEGVPAEPLRAQLKRWALSESKSPGATEDQGLAARLEALCAETPQPAASASAPAQSSSSAGTTEVASV